MCDVGQCGEHALELLNNSLDFLENHSTRVIQGLCLELISREGVQIKKHQPNESFVSFIKSTITPPAKPIADLKAPFVAIKEIAMLPFQQTPTKAELPANSYQTKLKSSGGAQSKAVMNKEQTVDNLDFFEECKLTFKTLFNPTRRTANKLFQRTLTDEQFKLVYWIADYARHPKITDENRELSFSKFRNLMEETAKHTPMTREIVTAVCRVAARVFEMRGFYGITAVTESIKEIGKHTAITPKIVKAIYSRAANYVPFIRTTELWPGGSVRPLTEVLNKIGTKTAITPEIVEAVCNVAGSARKYEPGTLSALTEALKSIKEPVTPTLITELGAAVRSVADSAGGAGRRDVSPNNPGYQDSAAHYALPALTAALTSIKEPVTPTLITKLGAAVCRVAARDRYHAQFTLRALTAALTAINEPVTPALITELGVDICNVPVICRYEGAYALIRLPEALKGIGTQTAITPEIVKAVCSVAATTDYRTFNIPALTAALRDIGTQTAITPEIVKAVCSVAANYGNAAEWGLPVLTARIEQLGTKEVLTPELILTILDREGAQSF